jgi:small subunit ribosomal protein S6
MNARATQAGAAQGADEERKGDVQESTSSAHRSQQRSDAPASTGGIGGPADEQVSTVRGSGNEYEIAVLYHPDLEIDLDKAEKRVLKIFTDNAGKVTKTDNWGKRKLAYAIKKNEAAVYVIYTLELPSEAVRKIEGILNITDEVIRYLITKPDLKAIAKAEAAKADKAAKAAERGDRAEDDKETSEEE